MTVQHADLFHCLACGRVAYEPHGGPTPDCCGQPMVCAVADVGEPIADVPVPENAPFPDAREAGEEHALFSEAVELANWCHRFQDVDVARSEEVAQRLTALHRALADSLEDVHRPIAAPDLRKAQAHTDDSSFQSVSERATSQSQKLMRSFAQLAEDLRANPSALGGWTATCDRFNELVAEFRRYVQTENELTRLISGKPKRPAH